MNPTAFRTVDESIIESVRDALIQAADPRAIYLFGSAAEGTATKGSDVDVLVVMELGEGESGRRKAAELRSLFRGWRLPMDILVRTPEQFEKSKSLPGFIEYTVAHHGTRIHAANVE